MEDGIAATAGYGPDRAAESLAVRFHHDEERDAVEEAGPCSARPWNMEFVRPCRGGGRPLGSRTFLEGWGSPSWRGSPKDSGTSVPSAAGTSRFSWPTGIKEGVPEPP